MIKTISKSDFITEFAQWENRKDKFSYDALGAIYDYLEEIYTEEPFEMDVVAICCDFTEYDTAEEYHAEYGAETDEEKEEQEEYIIAILDDGSIVATNH